MWDLDEIKRMKEEKKLTSKQLAEIAHVGESSMSRYLNGQSDPPSDVRKRVKEYLSEGQEQKPRDTTERALFDVYEKRVEDLRDTIVQLRVQMTKEQKESRVFRIAFFIIIVMLIIVIKFDAVHQDIGWIRY